MSALVWTGPFRIRDLLGACLDDDHPWPPASRGVYLVAPSWEDRGTLLNRSRPPSCRAHGATAAT